MFRTFISNITQRWPEYLMEILVIVFGITVSFMLNEWRNDRSNRTIEIQALQNIHDDLVADSTSIHREIQSLGKMDSCFVRVISSKNPSSVNADTLMMAINYLSSYTTIQHNDVGYQQLKETGQLNILSNKELQKAIIDLYTNKYSLLNEFIFIDRKMVLDLYIPYLMKQEISPLGKENIKEAAKVLFKQRVFQNTFLVNAHFKRQTVQFYRQLKEQIAATLSQINDELKRLSG